MASGSGDSVGDYTTFVCELPEDKASDSRIPVGHGTENRKPDEQFWH